MQLFMKKVIHPFLLSFLVGVTLLWGPAVQAQETIRIAVASNFLATLKSLAKDFNAQTGVKVDISNGATGMLYAQIKKGAPYDMFFSADVKRPQLLEQEGFVEEGSRFTYVTGKLVAWSKNPKAVPANLNKVKINNSNLHFVAIANPKTAPYGAAAQTVLNHYGLYKQLMQQHKIAIGENIGKTYHYVATGNAQLGLVAKSYVSNPDRPVKGQVFEIPEQLYPSLEQQAVILKGRKTPAIETFLAFLHSAQARQKIQRYGYGLMEQPVNSQLDHVTNKSF